MMTKDEALEMAIDLLELYNNHIYRTGKANDVINACKEALEQPTVAELNDEYLKDTNVMGLEQALKEKNHVS
jgi:hypothetical protein